MLDRFLTREEVGVCFAAADLVVLPYVRATQSGVVPIAVAHAKPVAVTAVGGLREQVLDGRTGYLVPPGDPGALAEAIQRYFAEADRDGMAAAIRELGRAWTWDGVAAALEALMRSNTNTVG
jgi:glycosyltransferase involved in cell wall biosynthesis